MKRLLTLIISLPLLCLSLSAEEDRHWDDRFALPNLNVMYAIAAGTNGEVYAGGQFVGGGIGANYIAHWDGDSWSSLGGHPNTNGAGDVVRSVLVLSNQVYVAGDFNAVYQQSSGPLIVKGIARWDGANWHRLGDATNFGVFGQVNALATDGTNLYVVG